MRKTIGVPLIASLAATAAMFAARGAAAEDWPQFRGLNGSVYIRTRSALYSFGK